MQELEEEPATHCLIETAFDVQRIPITVKESTIPSFDVNENKKEDIDLRYRQYSDALNCLLF